MSVHYREARRRLRLFIFDIWGAALIPINLNWFGDHLVLLIDVLMIGCLWLMERNGLSMKTLIRRARSWLAGAYRPGTVRKHSRSMSRG